MSSIEQLKFTEWQRSTYNEAQEACKVAKKEVEPTREAQRKETVWRISGYRRGPENGVQIAKQIVKWKCDVKVFVCLLVA